MSSYTAISMRGAACSPQAQAAFFQVGKEVFESPGEKDVLPAGQEQIVFCAARYSQACVGLP